MHQRHRIGLIHIETGQRADGKERFLPTLANVHSQSDKTTVATELGQLMPAFDDSLSQTFMPQQQQVVALLSQRCRRVMRRGNLVNLQIASPAAQKTRPQPISLTLDRHDRQQAKLPSAIACANHEHRRREEGSWKAK